MAVGANSGVEFEAGEVMRIERSRLMLLGLQPSEIDLMLDEDKWDVLEIHAAEQRAQAQAARNANQHAALRGRR